MKRAQPTESETDKLPVAKKNPPKTKQPPKKMGRPKTNPDLPAKVPRKILKPQTKDPQIKIVRTESLANKSTSTNPNNDDSSGDELNINAPSTSNDIRHVRFRNSGSGDNLLPNVNIELDEPPAEIASDVQRAILNDITSLQNQKQGRRGDLSDNINRLSNQINKSTDRMVNESNIFNVASSTVTQPSSHRVNEPLIRDNTTRTEIPIQNNAPNPTNMPNVRNEPITNNTPNVAGNTFNLGNTPVLIHPSLIQQNFDIKTAMNKSNIKREYKLTKESRLDIWLDYLNSELTSKKLLTVLNDENFEKAHMSIEQQNHRRNLVRDIIINHLDEKYHTQVINMVSPKEIIEHLKFVKRSEKNLDSFQIRKKINSMRFTPGKEKAIEFLEKFDNVIRTYENLDGSIPISDQEKRDAFFNAITPNVPDIYSINVNYKLSHENEDMTLKQLKNVLLQHECQYSKENKGPTALMTTHIGKPFNKPSTKFIRCYNCDANGHYASQCTMGGKNLRKCYNCGEFSNHLSKNCPNETRSEEKQRQLRKNNFNKPNQSRGFKRNLFNTRGGFGGKPRGSFSRPYNNNYNNNRNNPYKPNQNSNKFNGNKPYRGRQNFNQSRNFNNRGGRTNLSNRPQTRNFNNNQNKSANFVENKPEILSNDQTAQPTQNQITPKSSFIMDLPPPPQSSTAPTDYLSELVESNSIVPEMNDSNWNDFLNSPSSIVSNCTLNPEDIEVYVADQNEDVNEIQMENLNLSTDSGECLYLTLIMDTGATDHIICNHEILINKFVPDNDYIMSANKNAHLNVSYIGDLIVRDNNNNKLKLTDIAFSPDLSENLLSIRKFTSAGYEAHITDDKINLYDPRTKKIILTGQNINRMWIVEVRFYVHEKSHEYTDKTIPYFKKSRKALVAPALDSEGEVDNVEIDGIDEVDNENPTPSQNLDSQQIDNIDSTNTDSIENITILDDIENVMILDDTNSDEQNTQSTEVESEDLLRQYYDSQKENQMLVDKGGEDRNGTDDEIDNEDENLCDRRITTIDEIMTGSYNIGAGDETNYNKISQGLLWHIRLGHVSHSYLVQLSKIDPVLKGVKFVEDEIKSCDVCAKANITRLPFSETRQRSEKPLQVVHSDVMGPISPKTHPDKKRFIVVFIDDYSRYAKTYCIKHKSDVGNCLEEYLKSSRNELGENVKFCYLHSDQGTEFTGGKTQAVLTSEKAELITAPPDTPQHNGVAERFNRNIQNKVRTLMIDSKLPKYMWDLAVETATYIYNRTPHKTLNYKTPMSIFSPKKHTHIKYLKRFGCLAYVKVNRNPKTKFSSRGIMTFLVGYTSSGYLLYHPESLKYLESRNVRFNEKIVFGDKASIFKQNNLYPSEELEEIDENWFVNIEVNRNTNQANIAIKGKTAFNCNIENLQDISLNKNSNKRKQWSVRKARNKKNRKVKAERKPQLLDVKFNENDFILNELDSLEMLNLNGEDLKTCDEFELKRLDEMSFAFLATLSGDPKTYNEAMNSPDKAKWREAIDDELDSLEENKVWEIIDRPKKGTNIIDSRWIFKIKKDINGKDKYKARLVIRGFKDKNEYELRETYAPVTRLSSVRTGLNIINRFNLDAYQLDVKTAFLNGELENDIFMEIPDGLRNAEAFKTSKVCKLVRSLYGLRVSPKRWNVKFSGVANSIGLVNDVIDPCLFTWRDGRNFAFLILYVDDMLLAGNDPYKLKEILNKLGTTFQIVNMGEPKEFLGIQIIRNRRLNRMELTQSIYIEKILKRFQMLDCKPVSTPMVTRQVKNKNPENYSKEKVHEKVYPYREAVGSLLYLAGGTRPDISYAVNMVSRNSQNPTQEDWLEIKRIFRYLRGTSELGLIFSGNDNALRGYSDASYGDSVVDRTSTSGYIIRLFNGSINWRCWKQKSVATSTCEAEFVAMSIMTNELIALKHVIDRVLEDRVKEVVVYCDNKAAINSIDMAGAPNLRHVSIRYHHIKQCVAQNIIKVKWVPSEKQLADILTKPLPTSTFEKVRFRILLENEE